MPPARTLVSERRFGAEDFFGNQPAWRNLLADEAGQFPYAAVCQIQVWTAKECIAIGTGWLAGRATVITAAHVCVFDQSHGSYNVWLQFPSPLVQVWAADLISHQHFDGEPGMPFDVAALRLPSALNRAPLPGGSAVGVGFVEVPGFPQGATQLTTHTGTVVRADAQYLLHRADTFDGHSGAPILARTANGGAMAVGLHLGGFQIRRTAEVANVGLRLNGPVGQFIDSAVHAWG